MSDDELAMGGGMDGAGDFDDMSDGDMGDMGDFKAPPELPEGIEKVILTEAPAGSWKKPKAGDEVTVHYVGTLESDGSEFDSSRGRGEPFSFTLGKGRVIQGWDLGVATMKKGEVAKFTLAPEFAYGDAGSPPKIPEKASLVFEVELISWMSKDDLFGDEGVIKTVLQEGSGWKNPKSGDEVMLSFKVAAADGTVVEDRPDVEYVLGSNVLGSVAEACDKALIGMKRGEVAELKCSKDYSDGDRFPEGVTATLALKEIFETKDVSFSQDKSVMKKQVNHVDSYDKPKDGSAVKLFVEVATDGAMALPAFTPKVLEFTAGNGEVCDALECAVQEMKKGERSVLTIATPALVAEAQLGLRDVAADKVVLTMELQDFEKATDTYSMADKEKVDYGASRKAVGGDLFKSGRIAMALQRYKKVAELFNYIDGIKDEEQKARAKELKKVCELNKAACYLKLQEYTEAKGACDAVLKDESQNVKALYRRAQAELGLKNFFECLRDCKRVVELEPQNKDARLLLRQANAGQKEEDKKSKGLFTNMCKALGKGPIPAPYKEKRSYEEDDDGSEDAPMAADGAADEDVDMAVAEGSAAEAGA